MIMIRDDNYFLRGEEDDYEDNDIDSQYNENEMPDEDDVLDWFDDGAPDFDWSYSYSFPTSRRRTRFSGGTYGSKYMSFRRLYGIITDINGGEGFIDTYFRDVFPYTIQPDIEVEMADMKAYLVSMANDIMLSNIRITRKGNLDRRSNARRVLYENGYFYYKEDFERSRGTYIADMIKNDITYRLSHGLIPLKHINKKETFEKRKKLRLDSIHEFYASSQLVESVKIFFDIKGSGRWQTVHPNIMV